MALGRGVFRGKLGVTVTRGMKSLDAQSRNNWSRTVNGATV